MEAISHARLLRLEKCYKLEAKEKSKAPIGNFKIGSMLNIFY